MPEVDPLAAKKEAYRKLIEAPPRYIGDGVYASFDGQHIWLMTNRDDGSHVIALDTMVMYALKQYEIHLFASLNPPEASASTTNLPSPS